MGCTSHESFFHFRFIIKNGGTKFSIKLFNGVEEVNPYGNFKLLIFNFICIILVGTIVYGLDVSNLTQVTIETRNVSSGNKKIMILSQ